VNLKSDITSISIAPNRRWLILGVIGLAQVMVIMSLTVMNIALLSAQRALTSIIGFRLDSLACAGD
jgi:hypothetical protein